MGERKNNQRCSLDFWLEQGEGGWVHDMVWWAEDSYTPELDEKAATKCSALYSLSLRWHIIYV